MTKYLRLGQEDPMATLCRMALATKFEDLPDIIVKHAIKSILDTVAVTIGGSGMEGIPAIADFVREKGGKPESVIPFYGGKVPASEAGLAIGPMSRAMDLGDIHPEAGHCSEYIVPALLAASGLKDKVSGKEFVTAYVVGAEVLVRIGNAFKMLSRGATKCRNGGHFIFGCVAAVGKLLSLNPEELENAEGIASTMTQPHVMAIYTHPTLMIRFQHGFICQDAINACLLARRGITGPRQGVLDGAEGYFGFTSWETEPEALLKGLGEEWEQLNTMMKLYPAVIFTQSAIGGILDLVAEHDIKAVEVSGIEIDQPQSAYKSRSSESKWNPQTGEECQFSLPFVAATAVHDGDVFLNSYMPESRARQSVRDLMQKVSLNEVNDLPRSATRIRIALKDGRVYSRECLYHKGHPKNRLTDEALVSKLKKCVPYSAYRLNDAAVDSIVNTLLNLEKVDDVVKELILPLTPK